VGDSLSSRDGASVEGGEGDKLQIWTIAVKMKINVRIPLETGKISTIKAIVSDCMRTVHHGVGYEEGRRRQVPLRTARIMSWSNFNCVSVCRDSY
jgi:hypothetical protein